jgi:hypothetical protein
MVPNTTFPQLIGFDDIDGVGPDSDADDTFESEGAVRNWGAVSMGLNERKRAS